MLPINRARVSDKSPFQRYCLSLSLLGALSAGWRGLGARGRVPGGRLHGRRMALLQLPTMHCRVLKLASGLILIRGCGLLASRAQVAYIMYPTHTLGAGLAGDVCRRERGQHTRAHPVQRTAGTSACPVCACLRMDLRNAAAASALMCSIL